MNAGKRPRWRFWHWPALLLGLALVGWGGGQLLSMETGVRISHTRAGATPVTVFEPAEGVTGPAVVIAHGFAGSRALMRSFALNLARNGYLAVSFDFPGHGRHKEPLGGDLDSPERLDSLVAALDQVVDFTQARAPEAPLALLGHSMAGDILVQHARAHPGEVNAIVAVSPYLSETIGADFAPNVLFVYGEYEPEMIHTQGREAVGAVSGGAVELGLTYGDPRQGGARRLVLAEGVEHIGVLFNATALREALDWLDLSFDRQGSRPPVTAGAGLGWLYLGLCLLAWPLSLRLPPLAVEPLGAGLNWRRLWPLALLPAVLTPLILWPLPNDFLPLLIGDYLALHFLLYGALTWLLILRAGVGPDLATLLHRDGSIGPVVGMIAWLVYTVAIFGGVTESFVASFFPPLERLNSLLVLLLGTFLYASADAWLVHGQGRARAAGLATKGLFLLSLVLAVALNLNALFFLVIIVPAILLLFIVYGWLDFLAYRRTWQPLLGAAASALVFACAITATFPVVG